MEDLDVYFFKNTGDIICTTSPADSKEVSSTIKLLQYEKGREVDHVHMVIIQGDRAIYIKKPIHKVVAFKWSKLKHQMIRVIDEHTKNYDGVILDAFSASMADTIWTHLSDDKKSSVLKYPFTMIITSFWEIYSKTK